ncbi:P-type conjugative transfer protein TrbL (plasmid) [Citrobacter sp. OP27]
MKKHNKSLSIFITGIICVLLSFSCYASDVPQNNALDSIIEQFRSQTKAWEPIIHQLTLSLFWGLAVISFTWTFIQLVIKEGTGLVDIIAELTRRTLLIGFSVWMMNEAPNLARALINSFVKIGTTISGGAVSFSPSNVFELGINIITIACKKATLLDIGGSIMLFLAAIIILVCFALMAMEMTILIVSGYIIVSGGIVAMGFLGSDWTRDHAINYFTSVLGVAFKMFIMQLVFIVGYSFIQDWGNAIGQDSETVDYLVMLGSCIVFAGLMREIPSMAIALASGSLRLSGGGIASTLTNMAAGAAGGALMGGAVAGMMGGSSDSSESGGGSGGGSDYMPESNTPSATTMDTGPGDDGKAYDAYLASQQAAAGPSPTGSPSPSSGSSESDTATDSKDKSDTAKKSDGGVGTATKSMLESVANQTKFGSALAHGARSLGGAPADISTPSQDDVNRQFDDAVKKPSFIDEPEVENTDRFRNNITPADTDNVEEEKEQ